MFASSKYLVFQQEKVTQPLTWVTTLTWEPAISSSSPSIWRFLSQVILWREITPVPLWRHQHSPFTCYPRPLRGRRTLKCRKGHVTRFRKKRAPPGKPKRVFSCPVFTWPPVPQSTTNSTIAMAHVGCKDLTCPHRFYYLSLNQTLDSTLTPQIHLRVTLINPGFTL